MIFYAALHVVESHFANNRVHNSTHAEREHYIKTSFRNLWQPYHRLQSESMKARYLQGGAFSMNSHAVDAELRRGKYNSLRRLLRT